MKSIFGILFFCILVILPGLSLTGQEDSNSFEYYKKLNDGEKRLSEFRDNDEVLRVKLNQVVLINKSRARYKAGPVKLDILASRVANKQCREAAENGYMSHWNLAGEKPYLRYARAGGHDHVSENAYSQGSSMEFSHSYSTVADLMKQGHESFMKEKAPYDGHKKNDINKSHNFVGLGYFISEGEFRYNEEFIDRYLEFSDVPEQLKPGETGYITVNTGGNGFLYFMTIYREDFPSPMTARQLLRTGSYSDYTKENVLNSAPWDLKKFRSGDTYRIPVSFGKEGLYYIQLFTDKKEYTGYGSVTTEGKEPVSGIVISVSR
ncbi:MAG TPA: hypothetical protein VMT63_02650 [Bacteroidales bacterium]|nr:hypothetical protein [Bacteroidales bacterium]